MKTVSPSTKASQFLTCRWRVLVLKLLNHRVVFVGPPRAESLFCRHSPAPQCVCCWQWTRTRRLATLRDDGGNVKIYTGNDKREYVDAALAISQWFVFRLLPPLHTKKLATGLWYLVSFELSRLLSTQINEKILTFCFHIISMKFVACNVDVRARWIPFVETFNASS